MVDRFKKKVEAGEEREYSSSLRRSGAKGCVIYVRTSLSYDLSLFGCCGMCGFVVRVLWNMYTAFADDDFTTRTS